MDFTVLADRKVKLKESENKNKYLDLTMELKKQIVQEISLLLQEPWWSGMVRLVWKHRFECHAPNHKGKSSK